MIVKKKEKIFLDITNDKCPITFVKTKIALEKLAANQYLNVSSILYNKKMSEKKGLPVTIVFREKS